MTQESHAHLISVLEFHPHEKIDERRWRFNGDVHKLHSALFDASYYPAGIYHGPAEAALRSMTWNHPNRVHKVHIHRNSDEVGHYTDIVFTT